MSSSCVYDCRHPLWGGTGTCHYGIEDTSAICECDAGYASRDAIGNASCVPRRVLTSAYVLLATMSLLAGALVAWDINRHRRLPVRYQTSRKAVIRTRALLSTSVYIFGFAILGMVLVGGRGETGYADPVIWQANYILLTPSEMFAITMMAEYWVQSLPSQVTCPDSFTGLLRHASDNTSFFVVLGLANAAPVFTLGVLSFFFDNRLMLVGDLTIAIGTLCAVIVVLYVAVQTSGAINLAMDKGSARSRAFYTKAKKNLWLQAAILCSIGAAELTASVIKQLIPAGRRTVVLPFTAQLLCAHAAAVVFTLATRHQAPSVTAGGCLADDPAGSNIIRSKTAKAAAALSSAGAAMHDFVVPGRPTLLTKQPGRLVEATGKVLSDEKLEPRQSRACHDTSEDNPAQPMATKPVASGKTGAPHNPWNRNTARVVPTQAGLHGVGVDEEIVTSAGQEGRVQASVESARCSPHRMAGSA